MPRRVENHEIDRSIAVELINNASDFMLDHPDLSRRGFMALLAAALGIPAYLALNKLLSTLPSELERACYEAEREFPEIISFEMVDARNLLINGTSAAQSIHQSDQNSWKQLWKLFPHDFVESNAFVHTFLDFRHSKEYEQHVVDINRTCLITPSENQQVHSWTTRFPEFPLNFQTLPIEEKQRFIADLEFGLSGNLYAIYDVILPTNLPPTAEIEFDQEFLDGYRKKVGNGSLPNLLKVELRDPLPSLTPQAKLELVQTTDTWIHPVPCIQAPIRA